MTDQTMGGLSQPAGAGHGDFRMTDPFSLIGLRATDVAAGFAGGAVRTILRPTVGRLWGFGTTVAGAMAAAYLTPLVIALGRIWGFLPADAVAAADLQRAIAFSVGLTSMSLCEGIIILGQRWGRNPTLPAGAAFPGQASAYAPSGGNGPPAAFPPASAPPSAGPATPPPPAQPSPTFIAPE